MVYQIFVSYRRDGGEALACLISERLRQSGFETFYDVESLRSGKFNDEIFRVIDACTDVIVVLPQNGLDRCRNEEDWVRKEIAYAIKTNKNIIPIMMRNFEFPSDLPSDINDLRNFNGISANMEYFDAAFAKLVSMIKASSFSSEERIKQLTDDETLRQELLNCIKQLAHNNCAANKTALADSYAKLQNDSLNEEIAKLYVQAAELGYAPAQNQLAKCYQDGRGVEKSIEKAFEWFKKAADQGFGEAQYNLARCFERHHEKLAFLWIKKAADQLNPEALVKLAQCYENGYGTDRNYTLAKNYYAKAEERGNTAVAKKATDKYWKIKRIKDFFV